MLPIRDLCATAFCVLLSVVLRQKIINLALHFMPCINAAHERSFRVKCRHRSTEDSSPDGDTVDGATVVGRDPAFIKPVDPRVLY